MSELVVGPFQIRHEAALANIKMLATHELRQKYVPRMVGKRGNAGQVTVLVALKDDSVVGTAEYVQDKDFLYIQGIAVHPNYRANGVCRSILRKVEDIAIFNHLSGLSLSTIEETGNVVIFKRLGFRVVSRKVSLNYVSPDGGPVVQVNMERVLT